MRGKVSSSGDLSVEYTGRLAVPADGALRRRMQAAASELVASDPQTRLRTPPPEKTTLHRLGETLLSRLDLAPSYLGFAMICANNAFWREPFAGVPYSRRVLLLPRCLRDSASCRAVLDGEGLHCQRCGRCRIGNTIEQAAGLGYQTLVAEGTPAVLRLLLQDKADAVLGVACMEVLAQALGRVERSGVPSLAVPLLNNGCQNTLSDEETLGQLLALRAAEPVALTPGYLPLLRAAEKLTTGELEELIAGAPGGETPGDTGRIALEWLARGGKRFRPFMTLAAYRALATPQLAAAEPKKAPLAVRRVALAVEAFHKASLIHDDIEDDDDSRYGRPTLHRERGVPVAINVGDYLIGLGYRLVGRGTEELGAECVADLLAVFSRAHLRLAEGQGAELLWRRRPVAVDLRRVLHIYALKTAPAFEVALYAGLRCAGPTKGREKELTRFARYLGVGYQVRDDLEDWSQCELPETRLVHARPTVLSALAAEMLPGRQRQELLALLAQENPRAEVRQRLRQLYLESSAFSQAEALAERCRQRALSLAETLPPPPLAELLRYLLNTVLSEPAPGTEGQQKTDR